MGGRRNQCSDWLCFQLGNSINSSVGTLCVLYRSRLLTPTILMQVFVHVSLMFTVSFTAGICAIYLWHGCFKSLQNQSCLFLKCNSCSSEWLVHHSIGNAFSCLSVSSYLARSSLSSLEPIW